MYVWMDRSIYVCMYIRGWWGRPVYVYIYIYICLYVCSISEAGGVPHGRDDGPSDEVFKPSHSKK